MNQKTITIVKPIKSRLRDGGYELGCKKLESFQSDAGVLDGLQSHQVFQINDRFFAKISNPHVTGHRNLKEDEIIVVEFKTKLLCQLLLEDTWHP